MKKCSICCRVIKSSGEKYWIVNKKVYSSEFHEKPEVKEEIKQALAPAKNIIGWVIGGIVLFIILIFGATAWWWKKVKGGWTNY